MKYRISSGVQVLYYAMGAFITGFGLYLIQKGLSPQAHSQAFIVGFAILFSLFGLVIIANTIKTLVVMDDDRITVTTLFVHRSLAFRDITGYGRGPKNQFYLLAGGNEKNLDIPQSLTERDRLISFFTLKYPDQNAIQFEAAKSELLEDERFGHTKQERADNLKKTARIAMIANFVPMVLLFVIALSAGPYETLMWIVFSIPWVIALLTRQMKGRIALLPKRNNPIPSFFLSLVFSVMAAFVGTIPRFNYYGFNARYGAIFIAGGVVALLIYSSLCGGIFTVAKNKRLAYLGFGCLFTVYSATLILFSNCVYDRTTPTLFRVAVQDKHVSNGKSTTYYLTLSSWGKFEEGEDFSVSRDLYDRLFRRDTITVNLFSGKWGIPWYRLSPEATLVAPVPGP